MASAEIPGFIHTLEAAFASKFLSLWVSVAAAAVAVRRVCSGMVVDDDVMPLGGAMMWSA